MSEEKDGAYSRWLRPRLHAVMLRHWSHKPGRCRRHGLNREDIGPGLSSRRQSDRPDYGRYICPQCLEELTEKQLHLRYEFEETCQPQGARFGRASIARWTEDALA